MRIAVYPGSFDPITKGHIDILERSSKLFDVMVVAVVHNVNKQGLFTLEERVQMIRECTGHLPNLEIDYFSGLLVDYISRKGATAIVRGLRTVSDFEYELHMAMMNHQLLPEVDTVFIMSNSKYFFVSSSLVREAALLGADVSDMVPPNVAVRLKAKWEERRQERGPLR
ncbi:MAG: pantetheine-phosphate adenylyltransferase [Syntrophomonadaceae bacterium]|nr:pantetheine-phosphate adenylyltransferase [Syntrophomonadaceae bacterium]